MSFSLANVALIRGAAQIATGVAGRVGQAIGFDEILHQDPMHQDPMHQDPMQRSSEESADTPASPTELTRKLTETIRLELAKNSIELNHSLALSVHRDGSLRVASEHPQSARIEALLNSGSAVRQLASELAKSSGISEISIDLTSSGELGNMVAPGGYPNW